MSLAWPVGVVRAQDTAAGAAAGAHRIDVVDTMTNYNPILRAIKTTSQAVKTGRSEGRLLDFGTIRSGLLNRSYFTHLGIYVGSEALDMALLLALCGTPAGIVGSRIFSVLADGLATSVGYELGEASKTGEKRPFRETLGRALQSIDATNLAARMVGGAIGALLGQTFMPVIGAIVGSIVGSAVAGFLANAFIGTSVGKAVGDGLQRAWSRMAERATGVSAEAARSTTSTAETTGATAAKASSTDALARLQAEADERRAEVERLVATRATDQALRRALDLMDASQERLDEALAAAVGVGR